ncbi:MAG: energy-coupling factor ABC transporter ATP-binding protein [Candidatus Thorarchaeota archaeon]
MSSIQLENLWFKYPDMKDYILKSFCWEKDESGTIGILGTNGCGKTTLLKLIAGIVTPSRGRILIENKKIPKKKLREKIVFVPENARLFLVGPTPWKDLYRIIKERIKVDKLIDQYNFRNLADKKLYHLSEGQRRLIAIFHAFQVPSQIILLDEPTVGLDSSGRQLLFQLLEKAKEQGKIVFVSSNDSRIFPQMDELMVIKHGTLFLNGSPKEVLFELERNTKLIPNQIIRLITSLEEKLGKNLPHFLSTEEFNKFIADGRLF